MLKYFILALPLLIIVLSFFVKIVVPNGVVIGEYIEFNEYYVTDYLQNYVYTFTKPFVNFFTERLYQWDGNLKDFTGIFSFYPKLLSVFFNLDLEQIFDMLSSTNLPNYNYIAVLINYPLYCLLVYVFDLILDIFAVLPRLAHKFISKFGGDY